MGRSIHAITSRLLDVNGNVITSLSNASVLVGYSDPIPTAWASQVVFEVLDVAVGASVAPSAFSVEYKMRSDQTLWGGDPNYGGYKITTALVGNFWRIGSSPPRIPVIPLMNGQAIMPGTLLMPDLLRCVITIAATANLFTPQIKAFVIRDDVSLNSAVAAV